MATRLFLGVGYHGLRIVSTDGQRWQTPQTGKEGQIFRCVSVGNGRYVAAGSYGGSNLFAVSADGATWKTLEKDASYSRYIRGMLFAKDTFWGFGGDGVSVGNANPFETHTADGETWSDYQTIPGTNLLRRVVFGNGLFVGVGDRGRRAVATDAHNWKDTPDARALDTLVDVAFGNGVFVGVGLNGLRLRTTDGLTWSDRQTGEEGEHLNSILWTGDRFVAVGQGVTFFSPDGKQWQRRANQNAPLTATYGNGVFVGCQWKGRLLTSTDAVTWKETLKCDYHIEAVGFG